MPLIFIKIRTTFIKYSWLEEFNAKNPFLSLQIHHIFHPSIQPEFDSTMQRIDEFILNGFHYDANLLLEKSGMYKPINKVYGKAKYGAQECYKAKLDFGNEIKPIKEKTFFSANWSQEKVIQTILEAAQNRIQLIKEIGSGTKLSYLYECKSKNNLFIDVVFNHQNIITSAYPSDKNFN
jgi:hypothetical protein